MTITHVTTVEPAGQTAPSDEIRHSPRKTYPKTGPLTTPLKLPKLVLF